MLGYLVRAIKMCYLYLYSAYNYSSKRFLSTIILVVCAVGEERNGSARMVTFIYITGV